MNTRLFPQSTANAPAVAGRARGAARFRFRFKAQLARLLPWLWMSVRVFAFGSRNAVIWLVSRLVVALRRRWRLEVERRRRHRVAAELRAMSRHTLNDIGVSRQQIDWIVRREP